MEKHEERSAEISEDLLPDFGYTEEQISKVKKIVMATEMPQNPEEPYRHLKEILCDSDLSNFGKEIFLRRNELLYREKREDGVDKSKEDWYRDTLELMENHSYFTDSAKKLWEDKKEENMEKLKNKMK